MKWYLSIFLMLIYSITFSQNNNIWTCCWNADSSLRGYKDDLGIIKIEPKFTGITFANKFEYIIAAMEEENGKWKSYYLTKQGKIIGKDSLHIFDNSADCESEGFIRFKDKKTDKIGMFNRAGNIVIPAVYNELSRVRNGLIVGLKGAKKSYWEKEKHSGCEHYTWTGGKNVLIDTSNHVLAVNFKYENELNFNSLLKTKTKNKDASRINFLAYDGSYFSFIVYRKEFENWISKQLKSGLKEEKLLAIMHDTVYWSTATGWGKTAKEKIDPNNIEIVKNGLREILSPKTDFFITNGGLNQYIYEGAMFEQYFNNCGESMDWSYPTMTIIVNHTKGKETTQNHFEFLRTDKGYKLIGISLGDDKIK